MRVASATSATPCPRLTEARMSSSSIWTPSSTLVAPRRMHSLATSSVKASGLVSTVIPITRCSAPSFSRCADSRLSESDPLKASKQRLTNHSRYSSGREVKVPPMIIRSTLSV
ncbi:MAG: hypothetical protein A4E30_00363 [Methanomassiliicoccales archaeon PtaB.Bin215]|nr:MAG: hypothetical protein A4E30_00363 [Methanomassiliicoccales archaeon PtaB.Bin215]